MHIIRMVNIMLMLKKQRGLSDVFKESSETIIYNYDRVKYDRVLISKDEKNTFSILFQFYLQIKN